MEDLKGFEKKYLRGLAHSLKPLVPCNAYNFG
jgi:hypothetical protein